MISISISLAEVMTPEHADAAAKGALDPEQVWYEYVTMHDDRVRPSHAALDGTVWRVGDPLAPVPPIDYGCRCSMTYRGKPGTVAADILGEAKAELRTKAEVFATALDSHLSDWKRLATAAAEKPQDQRFAFLQSTLRTRGIMAADAKDLAMMILEASSTIKES